jgi:GT2 family glycosyltransferase
MSEPRVAIAVVSWNTRELLRACLRSLAPEHESGLAAVWVVDNGSSDGSAELVAGEFPWAELIASDENLGFGPAVNLVAERTAAPWIAPANADIELEPGALGRLLEAGEADPAIGSVAPRLLLEDGSTQHSVHRFPSLGLALAFNLGFGHWLPGGGERLLLEGRWDPEARRQVPWAHGAFLLVRRSAFDRAGGFDPAQWMYAEDLDLAWRLDKAGFSTLYLPAARVRHAVSAAALQAFGDERTIRHTVATSEWIRARRGPATALAYATVHLLGTGLRWLAVLPLALIRPRRWGPRRAQLGQFTRAHLRGLQAAIRRPDRASAPAGLR